MADTITTSGAVKLSSKALSLDEAALALLRAVDSGVRVFTPDGDTPQALADFQQTVRLLRMMEYRRYTEAICSLNVVHADGGGSRVDRVRLTGGLTEKGRAVLAHYDGEARGDFEPPNRLAAERLPINTKAESQGT